MDKQLVNCRAFKQYMYVKETMHMVPAWVYWKRHYSKREEKQGRRLVACDNLALPRKANPFSQLIHAINIKERARESKERSSRFSIDTYQLP